MARRVLVIGLDGVSLKTLTLGIESGKLPVMASLAQDGYMTQMQSHYLPHTPESIGCFINGKNPGKSGLFGWYRYVNGSPRLISSEDWTFPSWDYLNVPVLVLGLPLTYPAKPIHGTLVGSAHFSPLLKQFTFPENLAEVRKEYGYLPAENGFQATSHILRGTGPNLFAEERLATYLLSSSPWEPGIIYFQQTDIISHMIGMVSSGACNPDTPWGTFADLSCRTYDLAATILTLFGTSIPDGFDGRPFAALRGTATRRNRHGVEGPRSSMREFPTRMGSMRQNLGACCQVIADYTPCIPISNVVGC
jgi:predicted AlkP superfamily phosphohydrolase/phosphomutase